MSIKGIIVLVILTQCMILSANQHSVYQNRIVGGHSATQGDFPYLVSVQKMVYVYVHVCGGSLIRPNYALTAAHCLSDGPMRVRGGEFRIITTLANTSEVIERYVHPNYTISNNRTTNDLAILKLAENFTLSKYIQLINLPPPNYAARGKAIFSGWGSRNSSDYLFSNSYFYAVLDIISLRQCANALKNSTGSSKPLSNGNLCTYSATTYTCYRDDGGPLVQNNTLIGVSSWQIVPCDKKNAPSIFTEVSKYVGWINQQLV